MDAKGFLASIFDFSFKEVVTTRVIKILFVIMIIFAGLAALSILIVGFMKSAVAGIVSLIFAPLIFFLYVLFARIWCEIIMVMFRIAENTGQMVEQGKLKAP